MLLEIRVIPRASKNFIKEEDGRLKVYLTKPAQDNLANAQLIELLSAYLKVKKYHLKIIKGHKTRDKLVAVNVS
ncbi:MAG: DUF167 domain-containing protein [Candidatus Omnitrophica bacterium]|nr:DUF167 domain-containing protein [Candidatus Omnitrophota bacterium]